jgi:pimeloyl-ACP methyl ester carboxylesterase
VLALGGEFAQANQVIESARAVADNVTGGIIPNCGHWIPDEQPEALFDHLHTLFAT